IHFCIEIIIETITLPEIAPHTRDSLPHSHAPLRWPVEPALWPAPLCATPQFPRQADDGPRASTRSTWRAGCFPMRPTSTPPSLLLPIDAMRETANRVSPGTCPV